MEKKQTYWDKLQSPKWQKKRLEVLEYNAFQCQYCSEEDKQLHVHHPAYIKGREPWEYEKDELMVLCDKCHTNEHHDISLLTEKLNSIKLDVNLNSTCNMEILGLLEAYFHDGPFSIAICNNDFIAAGVGTVFRQSSKNVLAAQDDDGCLPEETIRKWKKQALKDDCPNAKFPN